MEPSVVVSNKRNFFFKSKKSQINLNSMIELFFKDLFDMAWINFVTKKQDKFNHLSLRFGQNDL